MFGFVDLLPEHLRVVRRVAHGEMVRLPEPGLVECQHLGLLVRGGMGQVHGSRLRAGTAAQNSKDSDERKKYTVLHKSYRSPDAGRLLCPFW